MLALNYAATATYIHTSDSFRSDSFRNVTYEYDLCWA